ncbi:MAG: PAS domain S-box protein [Syntrophaceae bacterium]|nr:PAS domain S-box protein [Syntrophaceae bacterium]
MISKTKSSITSKTRKKMEEELKKSEERYHLLADHMKDYVWLMDLNLKMTYISPSVEKLLGYTLEELSQLTMDKLLTATSFQKAMEVFLIEMEKASTTPSEKRLLEIECLRKNGSAVWIEAMYSFIMDENGKPLSILGEGRDITERKRVEEELKKSEEKYRLLADNITENVWLMDLNSKKMIYYSPSVEKMYGYTMDEFKNLSLRKILTPESFQKMVDAFMREMPKALSTVPPDVHKYSLELQARHKDGHLVWIESTSSFIRDENGNPTLVIGETRDITERRQAEEELQRTLENLRKSYSVLIKVLISAVEMRDPYTAGHQVRSADIARRIALEMGLSNEKIDGIRMAGSIHDIGKLSVPGEILAKPTKLTNLEFSLIKGHAQSGYDMLKDIESPWPLADIVYQHHERMDGSGYPKNLKGNEIILEARIMAVADVVEAMSSHRPYRAALGVEAALQEIEKNKGILYDDDVAEACLRLFREKHYKLT